MPPEGGWNFINAPSDMVREGNRDLWFGPELPMLTGPDGTLTVDFDASDRTGGAFYLVFTEDRGQAKERCA